MGFYLDQCASQQPWEEAEDGNLRNAVIVDPLGLTLRCWVGYFRMLWLDSEGRGGAVNSFLKHES